MTTIRARPLNGEMLELQLSDSDLADLWTVRDLKKRLAAADPSSPCPLTASLQLLSSSCATPQIRYAKPKIDIMYRIMCIYTHIYIYVILYIKKIYIYTHVTCINFYMHIYIYNNNNDDDNNNSNNKHTYIPSVPEPPKPRYQTGPPRWPKWRPAGR